MTWIFLDYESTGLIPEKGELLEIGLLALNPDLTEAAAWSCPINPPSGWQGLCDSKVLAMHEASGLRALLSGPAAWRDHPAPAGPGLPLKAQVEEWACQFLATWGGTRPELCGFNPDFDRRWLRVHMPKLHELFHYRSLDCNSLWLAERAAGLAAPEKPPAEHRALADCRAAAEVLRRFVARLQPRSLTRLEAVVPAALGVIWNATGGHQGIAEELSSALAELQRAG